ncbi:MAG: DUF1667 domain-containing protein [Brevinema sp.]
MKKDLVCILCPRGCHITVDTETLEVTGNACPRGAQFGPQEISSPQRLLTSTAPIKGALHKKIPVRTSAAIPFDRIFACVQEIQNLQVTAPVKVGQVLIPNILDTGVDVVAARSL